MGAILTSDMPGHRRLHERATYALDRCQESPSVEFKESAPWKKLQWQIIKTALAMANLRDGGIILIGVSQRGKIWERKGISGRDLKTFDVDAVLGEVNAYASPHLALDIVTVAHGDKTFLAVQVEEFTDTPLVCKKNGPNEEKLREGDVYVRPPGVPQTTRITNAAQMHDLLELAAEKRARRFLETAGRVGLVPGQSATERFDKELGGL
jgi:predicted HTH transcriptional regulator